ncbi:MAG: hypothetical protein H7Z21_18235, partial [Hymenobacter sp.]|nr:hypothetical protein [Hymenobacter sp.]
LALKLLAWAAACWQPSADALYMRRFAAPMTSQLWENPGAWVRTLAGDEFDYQHWFLLYHGYSNTFFMIKLLSVLNLASLSNGWWTGLYLSLFGFVACWMLVRTLAQTFPQAPAGAALMGFLVWPTVVYWSGGVTKESLVLGSAAGLVAVLVRWLYGNKPLSGSSVVGFVLLAVLQFKMRYFFAALLFGALGGLTVVRVVQLLGGARRRWVVVVVFAAFMGAGVWAGSEVSLLFRLNRITSQLLRNYIKLGNDAGERPSIRFREFRPTPESAARNAPQAAWEALSRPWFWEGTPRYQVAGLENLVLLAVVGVALVAVLRGRAGRLPFALVVAFGFYCLALAVLLGLSTPNLGTLSRYRAAWLPFVVWLALQNEYAARALRRLGL